MAHYPKAHCAVGRLTASQISANTLKGTVIVPPRSGYAIRILDGWVRAVGSAVGGCTEVIITDTQSTAVTVFSNTAANMTDGLVLRGGATGSAVTELGSTLGNGAGLRIGCTGTTATVTTGLDYFVKYVYEPVYNWAT